MKSSKDIHTKHVLLTTLLAFSSALVLCWFESKALTQLDWSSWKNENLVACTTNANTTNENSKDDKQVPEKNNGCSHQLSGMLCHTSTKRRKLNS